MPLDQHTWRIFPTPYLHIETSLEVSPKKMIKKRGSTFSEDFWTIFLIRSGWHDLEGHPSPGEDFIAMPAQLQCFYEKELIQRCVKYAISL